MKRLKQLNNSRLRNKKQKKVQVAKYGRAPKLKKIFCLIILVMFLWTKFKVVAYAKLIFGLLDL